MSDKTRSSLLSLIIIAVLFFGAMSPTTAYADDGAPPGTPPTEASSACTAGSECPSGEEVTDTTGDIPEATAEPTSSPDESTQEPVEALPEATAEVVSIPTEAPVEAGSEGDTSSEGAATPLPTEEVAPVTEETAPVLDSSILDQVPDNTTVTVLDTEGQSQPLATQDAADAIATSDPIWCPQGQDPIPGANGCTASFNSFDALLTFLSGNAAYQGAGIIYVQQGAYNGGESSIDFNSAAYDLSNINSSDLTVTGGWNTSNNTLDPAGTSTFTIPILIGTDTNPWGGSLRINNITIQNTSGTGLTLHSQNDITLVNVNVTNSANGAGAELNAGGEVTVSNSKFERNKTAGAIVRAGGDVNIVNSSFSNPANARRQITGLDIISNGSVTLANVLANENREVGSNVNAGGRVTIVNSFFSGTKEMRGSGAATVFLGYGLQVVTPGAIDLASVTASDNFLWGASLQAGGDVTIADSIFNANTTESPGFIDDTGLLITSGGSVALRNVQANDNRLIGATIDAIGDVAILSSTFSNNKGVTLSSSGAPTFHGYGLKVVTQGNIAVSLVTASNNTLFGAHLNAGGDVSVADSNFNDQTSGSATDQTGRGLEVISAGDASLINVFINNNQTFGANIQAGGNIFLDAVTATNNGLDGVDVQGICTQLTGGTYSGNGQYGLNLGSSALDLATPPTFANNGAGDILPANPATCSLTPSGNNTTNNTTNSVGLSNISNGSGSIQIASQGSASFGKGSSTLATGLDPKKLSLNSFLANAGTSSGGNLSVFAGNYIYIYSRSGVLLQIIALSPSSNSLAMDGGS